jgi:hypothetical protein
MRHDPASLVDGGGTLAGGASVSIRSIARRHFFPRVEHPEVRAQLIIEVAGLTAVLLSLVALSMQLYEQNQATKAQTEALRSSAYASLSTQVLDLDSTMLANPHLEAAFFSAERLVPVPTAAEMSSSVADTPSSASARDAEVRAMAFLYLDIFDSFVGQCAAYFVFEDSSARDGTEAWIRDQYAMSAILQRVLVEYRGWYPHLYATLAQDQGPVLDCEP